MEHQLVPADAALARLREGSARFISEQSINSTPDFALMRDLTKQGQDPWVVIINCIDSRFSALRVFDLKDGDAFICRTIGNLMDATEFAAVWYGVKANQIRLVVVLGHKDCGAVKHAMKGERTGEVIDMVVDAIQPAVDAAASQEGDAVRNTVVENAKMRAEDVKKHPDFKELVESGELKVVPAYYHLDTGQVDFLEM